MKNSYGMPIYYMNSYNGYLIYAEENRINVEKQSYIMPYHVHNVYIHDSCIIAYGKYFIGRIKQSTSKTYKCNFLVNRVWYYKKNHYALLSNGSIYLIGDQLVFLCKLEYSLICGDVYATDLYAGNMFGDIIYYSLDYTDKKVISYKKDMKKVHDGTIYDIRVTDKYVISCSNDRSISVMNRDLDLLCRAYNNRDRFFKCDIICDRHLIKKIYQLKRFYADDELIMDVDLYFYGITDNGNLFIYRNNCCLYSFVHERSVLQCIFINDGSLLCGYRNGMIKYKNLDAPYLSAPFIMKIKHDKYLYDKVLKFKPNIVESINNYIFIVRSNVLYRYENSILIKIREFNSQIIILASKMVVLYNMVYVTNKKFINDLYVYNISHVTCAKDGFIGTRYGYIIYSKYSIKISNDAISDIILVNNNLFLTSRDGNVYFLQDITNTLTNSNLTQTTCYDKSNLIVIKVENIYKKTQVNSFIEGFIQLNNEIYTYSFSSNFLYVSSFIGAQSYFLGFKPKKYRFYENAFYFKRDKNIYKIDIIQDKEYTHEDQYISLLKIQGCLYLITENTILKIKDNIVYDKYVINEINIVKNFNNTFFVGTQSGKIKILKEVDHRLWEINETKISTRIVDINYYSTDSCCYILIFDGFGTISRMCYTRDYKLEKLIQMNIFFIHSFYFIDKLYLISSDGILYLLNTMHLKPEINQIKKIHEFANTKTRVFRIDKNEYFLTYGDDHRIVLYDSNFECLKTLTCHSGTVVDLVVDEHLRIGLSLSIDKTIVVFSLPFLNILKREFFQINKPSSLLFDVNVYVFGQGYEKIDMGIETLHESH